MSETLTHYDHVASNLAATDAVFHQTVADKMDQILEKGLQPNPERGREEYWRKMEAFLDDIRPPAIKDLGISRRQGVYAHPDVEVLKPVYLSPPAYKQYWDQRGNGGPHAQDVMLAIDVDPDRVMVFDMYDINDIAAWVKMYNLNPENKPQAVEAGLRYWNEGMTLRDFRRYYKSKHTTYSSDYELRPEFVDIIEDKKGCFYQPEVIVPGPVVPESLYWAASSIVVRDIV